MGVEEAVNIADLRLQAKRRLPRVIFDIIDSASEDELVLAKIIGLLRAHTLPPRVLQGVKEREQATTLFGRPYPTFFGIAPMGIIGIVRKDVELSLALAAYEAEIPMILSGVSAHPWRRSCQGARQLRRCGWGRGRESRDRRPHGRDRPDHGPDRRVQERRHAP